MSFINWETKFSVNVAEIDAEHKRLIAMINKLHDAMKIGQGKEALSAILDDMTNYAVHHFHTEEGYMEKFNYPEYSKHKQEHDDFVAKVSDFREKFERDELLLSIEVMRFLSDWLRNHIMGSDQRYSNYFNQHGLH